MTRARAQARAALAEQVAAAQPPAEPDDAPAGAPAPDAPAPDAPAPDAPAADLHELEPTGLDVAAPAADPAAPPPPPTPGTDRSSGALLALARLAWQCGEPLSLAITEPVQSVEIHVRGPGDFLAWCGEVRADPARLRRDDLCGSVAVADGRLAAPLDGWAVRLYLVGTEAGAAAQAAQPAVAA